MIKRRQILTLRLHHYMVSYSLMTNDGAEIVLREPRPNDAKQLMMFINQIIREPMSGLPFTRPMTLKGEEAWLEAMLEQIRKRSIVLLILEIEGRIAGTCSVQRRMWKEKHRAQIGIALSKCTRGRGIGEVMMRMTVALARRRMPGLELIDLATYDYNTRALALYKKLGFRAVGRLPHGVKEGHRYYDDVFMVIRIDDLVDMN